MPGDYLSKNHWTADGERDNSRELKFEKNHTLEKNSEIVYCPVLKNARGVLIW